MEKDLQEIMDRLRKRFPACKVSGGLPGEGCRGNFCSLDVLFPSAGDAVYAIVKQGKSNILVGVSQHPGDRSMKPSGWEVCRFDYNGPEDFVVKFVRGAVSLLNYWQEFEADCDKALAQWNMSRPSIQEFFADELGREVGLPRGNGVR